MVLHAQHLDTAVVLGILNRLRLEAIQGHEGDTTRLFALHQLQDFGRCVVVVDHDVKETGAGRHLCGLSVHLGHGEKLVERTVHARQIMFTSDLGDGFQTGGCISVHGAQEVAFSFVGLVLSVSAGSLQSLLFFP